MEVEVQDTSGEALFDGPMADKAVAGQVRIEKGKEREGVPNMYL